MNFSQHRPWVRTVFYDAQPQRKRRTANATRTVFAYSLVMAGLIFMVFPSAVEARPPVPAPVFKAVRAYWKTQPERVKAFDVISCETGGRYNTTARNGQYLGLFQMGSSERAKYGHGSSAWAQARAAHAYYVDAGGWGPWPCG